MNWILLNFSKNLRIILILFSISLVTFSCNDDDTNETTQEQDELEINQMFTEIENLAASATCDNETVLGFTSYGHKACGGPVGYLVYSSSIDVEDFLNKIEAHRAAQEAYNNKWGISSTCEAPIPPNEVQCQDGVPVAVY